MFGSKNNGASDNGEEDKDDNEVEEYYPISSLSLKIIVSGCLFVINPDECETTGRSRRAGQGTIF